MCGLTALWRCHLTRSGLEFSITFSLQLVPKQNARNVRALSIYFGVLQFQAFGAFSSVSVHCSTHVPVSQFHQNMVPQSLALCNSIPSSKQIQKRAGDQVYFKVFQDFAKTKLSFGCRNRFSLLKWIVPTHCGVQWMGPGSRSKMQREPT